MEAWRPGAARRAAATRKTMAAARGEDPCCSRCGRARDGVHTYCNACHAAYMREWRRSHPLTPEQRVKDNARSYAAVYKSRGDLVPQPCQVCSAAQAEMHHPDYAKPLEVVWLCRECHLTLHNPDPYTRCSDCGGPRDRPGYAYCRRCQAAYMRDYRRRKAASRGVSRESTAEEVTMQESRADAGNGLERRHFSFVEPGGDDVAEARDDRSVVDERLFTAALAEDGDEAAGREVEAVAPPRTLSAAQFLSWLAIQTADALRIAEECRAGGPLPALDEEAAEPSVRPLPVDLPPLERRLLELQMRLARQNLDTARRIARADCARRDAFDAGLKIGSQGA